MPSIARLIVCSLPVVMIAALAHAAPDEAKKPKKHRHGDSAATQPSAAEPATQHTAGIPARVVGKWMYGSVSPTTYWNADTGAFVGNARGSAGIYEFDAAGHYKEYIYLELRTGTFTNKAWTVHEGTVVFDGDTFTIHPQRGHYQFWTSGKQTTDRDMKPEECEKLSKSYQWTFTKDDAGNDVFTVPFDDGSKMVYRRQAE